MSMFYDLLVAQSTKEKEPIYLEYLELDGGQWLNTGVHMSTGLTFSITVSTSVVQLNGGIFGGRDSSASVNNMSIFIQNLKIATDYNNSGYEKGRATTNITLNDKIRCELGPRRRQVYNIDKNQILVENTTEVTDTFTGNTELPLCKTYGIEFIYSNFIGRIYSFQAYDKDNKLIRNFRPCLNPYTLQPAMYDTVSKKYYYNQGTGEFKYELNFIKLDYMHIGAEETMFETNVVSPMVVYSDIKLYNVLNKRGLAGADSARRYWGRSKEGFYEVALHQMTRSVGQRDIVKFEANDINEVNRIIINGETVESPANAKPNANYFLTSTNYGSGFTEADIFGIRIEKDNLVLKDYIPVRRNDGIICFYDFAHGEYLVEKNNKKVQGFLGDYQIGSNLQGSGVSYLDTNYTAVDSTKIKAYVSDSDLEKWIFGSRFDNNHMVGLYTADGGRYFAGFGSKTYSDINPMTQELVSSKISQISLKKNELIINGEKLIMGEYTGFPGAKGSITLFALNGFTVDPRMSKCKYYTHVMIDDKEVHYYIPAIKDGFIGMVDVITGKGYHNVGNPQAGSFIFNE